MKKPSPRIISAQTVFQPNGTLGVVEEDKTIPFSIKRCFFIYDMEPGDVRGKHAVNNEQCIFLLSGECEIMVHDGTEKTMFRICEPMQGVYVPKMLWREVRACSPDCRIAVFSDKYYNADDYIREFDAFLHYCAQNKNEE